MRRGTIEKMDNIEEVLRELINFLKSETWGDLENLEEYYQQQEEFNKLLDKLGGENLRLGSTPVTSMSLGKDASTDSKPSEQD